jgi:hypothetical protein
MRRIQTTISIAAILVSLSGQATNSVVNIEGAAPDGMARLSTIPSSHQGAPENKGHHGLVEYCYQVDSFVVYSKNLLGHGYQLSRTQPEGLECVVPKKKITSANSLGMFVGMPKKSVEELIGSVDLQDAQTVIWLSDTLINGVTFDVRTYVEMSFEENSLVWISVFTTTTN